MLSLFLQIGGDGGSRLVPPLQDIPTGATPTILSYYNATIYLLKSSMSLGSFLYPSLWAFKIIRRFF